MRISKHYPVDLARVRSDENFAIQDRRAIDGRTGINMEVEGVVMRLFGSRALAVFVALALIIGSAYTVGASFLSGQSQDVLSLDRKIGLMEQRFYAMEARINRLEQQAVSQRLPSPATGGRDGEINLIINEIGEVRRRLVKVECGVVRLDERTLANRGKPDKARGNHPCRLNSDEPVSIPLRP